MRMWNINPMLLCRQHLLGEHNELHKLVGTLAKGRKINGFINNNLVALHQIKTRHKQLVREMLKRKYNHQSPLKFLMIGRCGSVDTKKNITELKRRCKRCSERMGLK